MKDCRNKELAVGDAVVWANRSGSSCWLEAGFITKIDEEKKKLEIEQHYIDVRFDQEQEKWVEFSTTRKARPYAMHKLMKVTGFPQ